MAKINSSKKLVLEDLPAEVRPWMKKVVEPLNRFLEQVYYALVNGLTITDNLKAQLSTSTVEPNQVYPIRIAWTLNERPNAVLVASISDDLGQAVPAYSMTWTYDSGVLKLTFNGLTAANKYNLKILGLV